MASPALLQCPECSALIKNESSLNRHRRQQHGRGGSQLPTSTPTDFNPSKRRKVIEIDVLESENEEGLQEPVVIPPEGAHLSFDEASNDAEFSIDAPLPDVNVIELMTQENEELRQQDVHLCDSPGLMSTDPTQLSPDTKEYYRYIQRM